MIDFITTTILPTLNSQFLTAIYFLILGLLLGSFTHYYTIYYPNAFLKNNIIGAIDFLKEENVLHPNFTYKGKESLKEEESFLTLLWKAIPLTSLFYKGCRKLSFEIFFGLLTVFIFLTNYPNWINTILWIVFSLWATIVSITDQKTTFISDNFSIPLIAFGLISPIIGISPYLNFEEAVVGFLLFSLVYFAFMYLSPRLLLGGGDLKILIGFATIFGVNLTVLSIALTPFIFFLFYYSVLLIETFKDNRELGFFAKFKDNHKTLFQIPRPAGPAFILSILVVYIYGWLKQYQLEKAGVNFDFIHQFLFFDKLKLNLILPLEWFKIF